MQLSTLYQSRRTIPGRVRFLMNYINAARLFFFLQEEKYRIGLFHQSVA